MSEKMECPACGSYLSSIRYAVDNGDPCPQCGLSAAAIVEVKAARQRTNDEALQQQVADALIRADRAETGLRSAEQQLSQIRRVLDRSSSGE